MLPRATLAEFSRAPIGSYFTGPSFVYFYPDERLCGFVIWGKPSAEEIALLVRAIDCELGPPSREHVALIDARGVHAVDAEPFRVLAEYVEKNWTALGRWVLRLAVLPPRGATGATIAGFYTLMEPPYPVRYFIDPRSALDWLGVTHDTLLPDLDRIRESVTRTPNDLYRLRVLLEDDPSEITVHDAAPRLGSSVRGLQRRLQELGTSFREELARARVARAQRLLTETDWPLAAIALEVGCRTQQHFNWLFRKLTGTTPARWREANVTCR